MFIVALGLGPVLSAWQQTWFSVIYIALIPCLVLPLGLLGFAIDVNYERVYTGMQVCRHSRPFIVLSIITVLIVLVANRSMRRMECCGISSSAPWPPLTADFCDCCLIGHRWV